MSTNHDRDLETRLRGMLTDRAEYVEVTSDFTAPAIARRRRDQRRTMIAAGVAAVAALAVAVPTIGALLPENGAMLPGGPTSGQTSPSTAALPSLTTPTGDPSEAPVQTATDAPSTAPTNAGGLSDEEIATTLAPFALGNTLHLPTGSFSLGDGVQITGFVTLEPMGSLPNGNVLVWVQTPDNPDGSPSVWYIPVATEFHYVDLGPADVVVSADGTRFASSESNGVIRVYDSSGTELHAREFPDQKLLAVDASRIYTFDALTWADNFQTWNGETGEIAPVTELPALASEDGRFTAQHSFENREFVWRIRDLTTGKVWEEGSTEALHTFNPVRFSADDAYLYSARGILAGGIHRTSDGAWLSPEAVDPSIWGYTPTTDGTGLLVVKGANDPTDDGGQSWLARCDFEFGNCQDITEKVEAGPRDGYLRTNVYQVAAQH